MAKKRRKLVPIPRLKRKADKALSEYIREMTRGEFGGCPLCQEDGGESAPVECCFHFIRRRRLSLRWDERNLIGSCHRCNYLEYRNPDPSRAWFIRRFGVELYLRLVDESKAAFEPTRDYLQSVIAKYTFRLKQLKETPRGPQNPA